MHLLALDSATEHLALALVTDGEIHSRNLPGGAAASAQILPQALALLAAHGLALGDLNGLAVGQGPGAFTGLRTAISVAQGLGLGLGLQVARIDSLLIVAEDARAQCPPQALLQVQVAQDARMGQIYAARYVWDGAGWACAEPPALWDVADLAARPDAGGLWAGSGLALLGRDGATATLDRAAALGRLAVAAWRGGEVVAPQDALPVYVRDKVALTSAERAASR